MRLAALLLSLCTLFASGARCYDSAATDTMREFDAFATPVRIEILAADPVRAAAAIDEIERYYEEIGRDWYAFGDGELAGVNASLSRGEPAVASATLMPVLIRAIQYQKWSHGLFDPASVRW